ncbi:hypothetical protein TWF506_004388 [Arthrobotrys conoides]|uniref:BTB domain-containing protein n=1 Tax=Arthrobotrys conoides TaxID=74498 RepID=A0AAN8NJY7_9PEZI
MPPRPASSSNARPSIPSLTYKISDDLVRQLMLKRPLFTDATVFVGSAKEPFKLHSAAICQDSEFLQAARKPNDSDGTQTEIDLPNIDPETFQNVVNWQYQRKIGIEWNLGESHLKLFEAAKRFALDSLYCEVLVELRGSCHRNICNLSEDSVEGVINNLATICARWEGNPSYINHITTKIAPY